MEASQARKQAFKEVLDIINGSYDAPWTLYILRKTLYQELEKE